LFIPQTQKIEAQRTLFFSQIGKIEAKSVYSTNLKDGSGATQLIPEIGKIEAKKKNWMEVKRTEAVFFKLLRSPGIHSKELIPQAYALAGMNNDPIQAWFLVPLDCSQVPAKCWYF
jgi:hypothetical protein